MLAHFLPADLSYEGVIEKVARSPLALWLRTLTTNELVEVRFSQDQFTEVLNYFDSGRVITLVIHQSPGTKVGDLTGLGLRQPEPPARQTLTVQRDD
jgi:hypothetical protein